ncbi:hypothetical protein GLYMA_07G183050v4 [Glycine max]|nr:hypothetical protein GLYMA_07G183050v4 [Glycine max]KAH1087431.1 hypothetical protein GYH30_018823 [Glycine max]
MWRLPLPILVMNALNMFDKMKDRDLYTWSNMFFGGGILEFNCGCV